MNQSFRYPLSYYIVNGLVEKVESFYKIIIFDAQNKMTHSLQKPFKLRLKLLCTATLALLLNLVHAQEIDSLIHLAAESINPNEKVDYYIKLAHHYSFQNNDSVLYYAELAYKKAIAINYKQGELRALMEKCTYYLSINDREMANSLMNQAQLLAEKIGDKDMLAAIYLMQGDFYANIRIFDEAFTNYTYALDLYKLKQNKNKIIQTNTSLGILNALQGNYAKALEMFEQSLNEVDHETSPRLKQYILINMANAESERGNAAKALHIYQLANQDYQTQVTKGYQTKDSRFLTANLVNQALIYQQLKKQDSAMLILNQAADLADQLANPFSKYRILQHKAEFCYEEQLYDQTIRYALEIVNKSNTNEWTELASKSSLLLSKAYSKQENYEKAYNYYKEYNTLRDRIAEKEKGTEFAELQLKYALEKNILQQKGKAERKTLLLSGSIIILLILSALISILFVWQRTRTAKVLLQQKNLILEQKQKQQEYTDEINLRNKELSSGVITIQKKNEILKATAEQLKNLEKDTNKDNSTIIHRLIKEITSNANEAEWLEFEGKFNQIHDSFYKKLDEINPNLTIFEKRLCGYLKLKMTSKEIANLTNSSPRSVEVARYRLRKKLNLTNNTENLTAFLEKI